VDLKADLQKLLHNKWALAGLGGAAALGLGVWYTKRGKGGSGSASGATDTSGTSGTTYTGTGTVDTSGSDIANWLGQQSGNFQTQFDAFSKQQTDFLTQLGTITGGSGSGTTGGTSGNGSKTKVYTISAADAKAGKDTFYTIAHRLGLSGDQLKAMQAPGYSWSTVKAGNHLNIPA
jgi:hypothetical protein